MNNFPDRECAHSLGEVWHFNFWARSQNYEKLLLASSCLSVCPSAYNNSASIGRIFVKFGFNIFLKNLLRNLKFRYNLTRITGTLHEDRYMFLIISRSFLLRMRNVSDKFAQKIKTYFMFNNLHRKSKHISCSIICTENQNIFHVQ